MRAMNVFEPQGFYVHKTLETVFIWMNALLNEREEAVPALQWSAGQQPQCAGIQQNFF